MGKRREARELAVQFLYQLDSIPDSAKDPKVLETFFELTEPSDSARTFAAKLIEGVRTHLEKVDGIIEQYCENWSKERLAAVDRNILRLAIYEMHFCPEIPPVVSINEAVEVAKRLSTEESGRFVNGLLDRARKDLDRPARKPAA